MGNALRLGEHADGFEEISPGGPGTLGNPFTHAPGDFAENGLPYGAWCRCHECDRLGRSTHSFDFYADAPGLPLTCEDCKR